MEGSYFYKSHFRKTDVSFFFCFFFFLFFVFRFRVENTDISEKDVGVRETSFLSSSLTSDKSKPNFQSKMDSKQHKNLLRSQSVYNPTSAPSSRGKSPVLVKQSSLSVANADAGSWKNQPISPKEEPVVTLASSFTDKSHVTFGFDVTQEKNN